MTRSAIPESARPLDTTGVGLPRLRSLGEHVSNRAQALQSAYLQDVSSAVASLARLRRAAATMPGDDPQAWAEVFKGIDYLGHDTDEPTADEWAAHLALTLFAVHQQSQSNKMHQRGFSLGRSVRNLADVRGGPDDEGSKALRRRFQMLGTAQSVGEAAQHARGLITQLRSEQIPLDYGLLADHLVKLQSLTTAPAVRLAWGRDFYRTLRTTSEQPAPSTAVEGDTA